MKYLLIQSWQDLGGAERQAINFATYLMDQGDDVTMMCLTEPGRVAEICAERGIPYVSFPPRNSLYSITYKILNKTGIRKLTSEEVALKGLIRDLKNYINANGFDICISYCAYANTVLGCAKAEGADAVCIWSQRDAGFHDHTEGLEQIAADSVDGSFSNSTSGSDWIRETFGLDPVLIYNGVTIADAEKTREEWRKELGASDEDVVCTMVANLTPFKNHMFLLKVWKELIKTESRYILVFAGKYAAEYENLYNFAQDNGLTDHVRFLGAVKDVSGLWAATDLCVHSAKAHCEGTPNAVIEADMFGLPVIGPDLPEIREAVSPDCFPWLHEYENIDRAIDLIKKISTDRALYEKLGLANKKFAHDTYDYYTNLKKLKDYAESLIPG